MRKIGTILLIGITLLFGCSTGSENWNDHIDAKSREQIKILDDKIIEAFNENNPQKLKELFSDELKKKSGNEIDAFIDKIHESFKTKNYSLLDEYLATNSSTGMTATAMKGVLGEYDYKINYPVLTKETYISLLLDSGSGNKHLITCIYGKYGSDWKLNVLKIGDYSYFGKTAIDFYKQAKANYEKGNLIDATNDIVMIQRTATPADDIFHYQSAEAIAAFANKVIQEANAQFRLPKKIEEIKTNPQILNVSPIAMAEGIYPTVGYLSKINLKDTVALKKENDELKKIIGNILPGIDKGKKYVFFKVYNEIPNGKTPVESYGFILTILGQ
jgi:hypothetical protein